MMGSSYMSQSPPSPGWIPIASFVPARVDAKSVEQILQGAGIGFRTEGSRATQILVARDDAPRAVEALKRSQVAADLDFYPAD